MSTHSTTNNRENIAHTTDCAMSFYDQLEDVATASLPIRERYLMLRDIFKRIINQGIVRTRTGHNFQDQVCLILCE